DRWGTLVFEESSYPAFDTSKGWDGTLNGQRLNAAVFVYYGELRLNDGSVVVVQGDVTLVR
ncbi:MAG: gliding motility-associated C-terminal domain-containing protein, partial [Bacteroidota bacterium]